RTHARTHARRAARRTARRWYPPPGGGAGRTPGPPRRARPGPTGAPRSVINREHRTPNMPGFHDVMRCARCGQILQLAIGTDSTCPSCGTALHTCAQCASFDTGSRFECLQPIAARVSPKDERNECAHFGPRVTVERQTHSERFERPGSRSTKQAFDDLFK
ncbi:MAG: hypothetical protein QF681_16145, partial [Vicinamibacterales bacterium]|nr:hypothetical protein [Vicinamibacterales bacterium]